MSISTTLRNDGEPQLSSLADPFLYSLFGVEDRIESTPSYGSISRTHSPVPPSPARDFVINIPPVEPTVKLIRGNRAITVRRYYQPIETGGWAMVRELLETVRAIILHVDEEQKRHHTNFRWSHCLEDMHDSLAELHTIFQRMMDEDQRERHISLGLQGFLGILHTSLQAIVTHFKAMDERTLGIFHHKNRSRRAIIIETRKLAGFTELMRLCYHIHATVDVNGRLTPFPTPEEIARDEIINNWIHLLSRFDPFPHFRAMGQHFVPRLFMFHKLIIHATAASSKSYGYNGGFMRALSFGFWNFMYSFSYKSAAKQAAFCFSASQFDFGLVKFLWNLPESPGIRTMFSFMYHDVSLDELFSIPNEHQRPNSHFHPIPALQPLVDPRISRYTLPESYTRVPPFVRARLVSAGYLPFSPLSKALMSKRMMPFFVKHDHSDGANEQLIGGLYGNITLEYPLLPEPCPAIIMHVHGGGFVSMTSFSHGAYMRKWALDTGVPVLSIDYRLAPQFPYPVQLEECWQAYRWMVKNSLRLGSTAEKIILVGDSAGGNLVAGLTVKILSEGFRRPDMLIMAYPVVVLSKAPSCSRAMSPMDPMLNASMLLQIQQMYLAGSRDPLNDPLLSPGLASDEFLREFPPVRIIVGQFDPLLDDAVHMHRRLVAAGHQDVVLSLRPGLAHGFLNLADFVPEANEAVALVSIWILEQMARWGFRTVNRPRTVPTATYTEP